MKVAVSDHTGTEPRVVKDLVRFLVKAGESMGVPDRIELSLVLVNESEISDLNRKYLNRKGSTDVLAFPLMDLDQLDSLHESDEEDLLGDVVICAQVARSQAKELGHAFRDELSLLAIHGLLHLLGSTHENNRDERDMRVKEKELINLWESIGAHQENV